MASEGRAAPAVRKATTFQLVFMTYSVICSGAYGLEEMVSSSGPGMTMLTLVVLPFVWAVPVTLACAELSALYPVEGGYYRWARMAFGDFTGYMAGWLVWLANLATNGTFAVLFANYLRNWFPDLGSFWHGMIAAALVWATISMNYRGIRLVGTTSVVLTILIFFPFLVMSVMGLLHWKFNPLVPFLNPERTPVASFSAGLMIAVWLYSGYEKLTTNAGEVENPSRAFPIALAISVPMTALSYIVPTFTALAGNDHWRDWGESYFVTAARALGGPLVGHAMAAGGLVSDFCLLMVTILGQSRLPMVLAEDGLFPRFFGKTHRRFGTPVASLLVGGVALTGLCWLKFSYLTGLFSLVQVLAYLLIFAALIRLRSHRPVPGTEVGEAGRVERAAVPGLGGSRAPARFRIPLGTGGLMLMTIPSVVLSALVIRESVWHDGALDGRQTLIDLLIFASGPATFYLFRRRTPRPDRVPTS
jgi:amino acid transporter